MFALLTLLKVNGKGTGTPTAHTNSWGTERLGVRVLVEGEPAHWSYIPVLGESKPGP